jgi:choline dehydrogenase-like flavoprotein
VLESGNEDVATVANSDCLSYESSGSELEPEPMNRARAIGGTACIWNTFLENRPAARYFRMDAVDFEKRPGLPHGGWPFTVSELDRYYAAAERRLMPDFSREQQRELQGSHGLPIDPARLETVAEPFGFADTVTRELVHSVAARGRVRLIKNATVTRIETQSGQRAYSVRVAPAPGRSFNVDFRALVLAAGTIENARLLLISKTEHSPNGLGNSHDLVGRFFMDHQRLNAGRLVPFDAKLFDRSAFFDLRKVGRQFWMGKIKLSERLLRERELLNSSTLLWPRPRAADDRGVDALKELRELLKRRELGHEALSRAREVASAGRYLLGTGPLLALYQRTLSPNITRGGWSHLRNNQRRFEYYELVQQIEQVPAADNRITLSERLDRYAQPLPKIHARFSREDLESAELSQQLLNAELERSGVGRVQPSENAGFPDLHQTGGIHHNLGGTRMHTDPKQGVVDENARLHDVSNVFVAGGSVFPTGGYSNPTLTMAALTLRLGEYLAFEFGAGLENAPISAREAS